VSTANSKAAVISSRCAIFRPATAEFRLTEVTLKNQPRRVYFLVHITTSLGNDLSINLR
jgi:hypothetical protein